MRFADDVLLRLCDATGQSEIFDVEAGRDLVEAAYVVPQGGLQAVTAVLCRTLLPVPRIDAAGTWLGNVRHPSDGSSWLVDVSPAAASSATFLDAAARLRVTAGGRAVRSSVTAVSSASLRTAVTPAQCDAYIVARDGALPDDAGDRERARLDAAGALLTAAMGIPEDFDAAHFFATHGLTSAGEVTDWLEGDRWPSSVLLDVVTEASPPGTPLELELDVHVLASQHDPVDLRAELVTIQTARHGLDGAGAVPPTGPWPLRNAFPVLLVLPDDVLDDAALPLPSGPPPTDPRAARLRELNRRLRPLGVAAATV